MRNETQQPFNLFQEATDLLKRHQEFVRGVEVGSYEATYRQKLDYPNLPVVYGLFNDIHFGSTNVDYQALEDRLEMLEDTPNMSSLWNGDYVDNFGAHFFQSGMFENPIKPQLQSLAIIEKLKDLDKKNKIAGITTGNHDDFMEDSGYEWAQTFARNLKAPLMPSGGLLTLKVGKQTYKVGMAHRYFGYSKLNPTNMAKRYLEHEYPDADIIYMAHTHQSEVLHFERGGKDRIAIMGGTLKIRDEWARKRGIGGRGGTGGFAIMLDPNERHMQGFKTMEDAQQNLLGRIWMHEYKEKFKIEDGTVFDSAHIDYIKSMRKPVDKIE